MENTRTITEKSFTACLPAACKNNPIYIYDTIDSTNTKARQLALDGAPDGTIVIACQQTGGRGRLGRNFFSPREGIYMSLIIKPTFDLSKSILITSAAAVAVTEAIETVCGVQAGIKWVNDVYVSGKKVCGILSEGLPNIETGRIDTVIIGIGLNTSLKGFPQELLKTAGAIEGDYSRSALAAAIAGRTVELASTVENREFIETYKKKSLVLGKTITVYKGVYRSNPQQEISGRTARVIDIDENGGLVVLYSDGTGEALKSGEISVRL